HGKLWFNEDDTRTSVSYLKDSPTNINLWDELLADVDSDLAVLDRNFGSIMTHRAATWWMDLIAGGQFQAPEMWAMLRERIKLYQEIYDDPTADAPEAALIVDEDSKLHVKDDWDANWWMMYKLRDDIAKAGTSVGYYALADFIEGVVPECKAYVFANAFALSEAQAAAIRERLDAEEATAIWIYAPGFIGGRVEELTGISVEVGEGTLGSEGEGMLAGESWGAPLTVTPRLSPTSGEALGHYRDGGPTSAARTARDVLLGDLGPTPSVLRKLLETAGCHIWTRNNEVVLTDGQFLIVHSAEEGPVDISAPQGVTLEPLTPSTTRTRWYRLTR
ncbi:MAG TPA: hypothetical protein QGH10_13060, partial [Armatimonadota bacterium]|nr:hypothetical protein [Armatimonadota bacterium]